MGYVYQVLCALGFESMIGQYKTHATCCPCNSITRLEILYIIYGAKLMGNALCAWNVEKNWKEL
jgi:hypothetical protein